MSGENAKQTLLSELARRRSRSASLTQRAIEQGLATLESADAQSVAPAFESSEPPAWGPAFDEAELVAQVRREAVQDSPAPEAEPFEGPAEQQGQANAPSRTAEPEATIAASDPILEPEPTIKELEEAALEAERIAEQIGQVVDIQRLPKTRPSRVLSRSAKLEAAAQQTQAPAAHVSFPAPHPTPPEGPLKKKKKSVTLLDSYFKGL